MTINVDYKEINLQFFTEKDTMTDWFTRLLVSLLKELGMSPALQGELISLNDNENANFSAITSLLRTTWNLK